MFPFGIFLLLTELAKWLPDGAYIIYVTKTIIVGGLIWLFRHQYASDFSYKFSASELIIALLVGVFILIVWIAPENYLPKLDVPKGFNPYGFGLSPIFTKGLIVMRLFGAIIVTPIMEELFWRSFLLRYLINPDFKSVSPGTFTSFSFLAVAILFGVEHHRFLVGIVAGILYNFLMIRQKYLISCIVAHGITNLGLGIYVLFTRGWSFW